MIKEVGLRGLLNHWRARRELATQKATEARAAKVPFVDEYLQSLPTGTQVDRALVVSVVEALDSLYQELREKQTKHMGEIKHESRQHRSRVPEARFELEGVAQEGMTRLRKSSEAALMGYIAYARRVVGAAESKRHSKITPGTIQAVTDFCEAYSRIWKRQGADAWMGNFFNDHPAFTAHISQIDGGAASFITNAKARATSPNR